MPPTPEGGSAAGPVLPAYGSDPGLRDVVPSLLASLGVRGGPGGRPPGFTFAPVPRAVVVLIDGLGFELLRTRAGHAPWLRSRFGDTLGVDCGFPSTTATSMGSFGTGLSSGEHGLVGYEVLDPGTGRLLNELSWEDGPVPERWQPHDTLFERAERHGVVVTRIGPGYFDGSGLTRAALRGGRFVAAESLDARVDAAVSAAGAARRTLTYLYWGDLDKVGHVHGCRSWEWGDELERVDAALARLARSLPRDTSLTVTADHGMVDVSPESRIDLVDEPELRAGVHVVAGEPRSPQVHCVPGALEDVRAAWTGRLGESAWVWTRAEAVALGCFGAVTAPAERIGDLVVAMRGAAAVVDSARMRPAYLGLLGHHGSLTGDEVRVPVLHVPARVA